MLQQQIANKSYACYCTKICPDDISINQNNLNLYVKFASCIFGLSNLVVIILRQLSFIFECRPGRHQSSLLQTASTPSSDPVALTMAGEDSITGQYEFLDHTADIQIHAWGGDLREAFQNGAVAMTAYITDINAIEISQKETFQVEADDHQGLFYRFLDAVLFLFNAEPYLLSRRVKIVELKTDTEFKISAECSGEPFSLDKHTQGTEIKAITYSAMKIIEDKDRCDVFFIVDI